ncbi:hypothetical protein QTP88_020358 [Uroleucon formosanum]
MDELDIVRQQRILHSLPPTQNNQVPFTTGPLAKVIIRKTAIPAAKNGSGENAIPAQIITKTTISCAPSQIAALVHMEMSIAVDVAMAVTEIRYRLIDCDVANVQRPDATV